MQQTNTQKVISKVQELVVPAPATGNVATFVKPTESNDAEKLALIKKLLGDLSIDSLRTLNTECCGSFEAPACRDWQSNYSSTECW